MSLPLALIVEDDEDAAIILREALIAAGYDVTTAHNGTTAQQILEEQTPALVSLDLHLPGAAGTDLLRFIRANNRLQDTRIMVVTADYRLAEGLNQKADLILLKPVTFTQIKNLARRVRPVGP